jgi:hypothetical protein
VAFDHWAGDLGLTHSVIAGHLDLAPGTLGDWQRQAKAGRLDPRPLGRPCVRSGVHRRNAAIGLMRTNARVSLPALCATFPKMPRRELENLRLRFRRHIRHQRQRLLHVLHWHQPGTVWAMDHCDLTVPIDGLWPHLFAVRDLGSSAQLAWQPVLTETAHETIAALEALFRQFGPPLVLKCDNGSGFAAELTRNFLDAWQVLPLFSPPWTPEYNGACEAGNGALKTRTEEQAARAGRPGLWTADDAETARRIANEQNYPWGAKGPTPDVLWKTRTPITNQLRAAFRHSVHQQRIDVRTEQRYPLDTVLDHDTQAELDRIAIPRALVEHGLLTFTRRSIPTPITTQKTPNIS